MKNPDEVLKRIETSQHNQVKFAIADMDGVLRGKVIHRDKFLESANDRVGFCNVIFGWDVADRAYTNARYTGWHSGYPDADTRLDLRTLRHIPWENDNPFFLADLSDEQGNGPAVCPRSLLKKVYHQCQQMGYTAYFAQEFEWFNFENTPQELSHIQSSRLQPITPGMFGYSLLRPSMCPDYFNALFNWLERFDIPLEGLHTETGPGVYEAAIRYDELIAAADKATLFKTSVKEIAHRFGIVASFMAKWNKSLPGCSGHIHQSLWNADKTQNLFFDEQAPYRMSKLFEHYLAGQLHCLPHLLPLYAPTVNSYKRLLEGSWAPTTLSWGIDNRTTALRVLNGNAKSCRLEMRVSGSDTNPYLAMAACLASGLYGIRNQLSLLVPATTGSGYDDKKFGVLPTNLLEATTQMQQSPLAQTLLGENFVDHFTRTRQWEWQQFESQVTDWELQRYFEII
ncbi:MAG: glutamine synthetase [Bacteroidia bacterium]|nr:glutamine synthetase [Bacteroidia bacterium]